MHSLLETLKNPLVIFGIIFISCSTYFTLEEDNLRFVVRSDGRGYYAYLPALFIYNDGSFQKSAAAEKSHFEHGIDQLYLFKDANGNQYNKYFPGIAVLQLPFFGIACLIAWLFNQPVDGYSSIFLFCFYLGSLFYSLLGIRLFSKVVNHLYPQQLNQTKWIIPLLYLATPLFYYHVITPSFSHLYSFVFFGLFAWQFFRIVKNPRLHHFFLWGLILGMITILRPTNLSIVLIIPFLAGSWENTVSFFKQLFAAAGKHFFASASGFILVVSLVFVSWKWQTGNWIVWSYSGEGFTFLSPQLWATLFSFRIGLLVHTPILLLAVSGALFLFKTNRFQAISWSIYFVATAWIIASWWCWDYESPFGHRPMTEHLLFLVLPLFPLVLRYKKISVGLILLFSIVGGIRFYEIKTGFMADQRFTNNNYFSSLNCFSPQNRNRWNFTQSCVPFGTRINSKTLLHAPHEKTIAPMEEFSFTAQATLPKPRTNEKFAYRVTLQKRISTAYFKDVYLVIDAYTKSESKRYYKAIDLFNDREEGRLDWSETLVFEGHIHDYLQEYDEVKIYLWNPGKQHLQIRHLQIQLDTYKAD